MSWMKTNQKMMKILNGVLRTILLLMMNSRTQYYVIIFISKFNLVSCGFCNVYEEKMKKQRQNF